MSNTVINPAEEEDRLQKLADDLGMDFYRCLSEVKNSPTRELFQTKTITSSFDEKFYFWVESNILYQYVNKQSGTSMDYNLIDDKCMFYSKTGMVVFVIGRSKESNYYILSFKTNNEQSKSFSIPAGEFLDKIQSIDWPSVVNLIDTSFRTVGEQVQNWFVNKLQSVTCSWTDKSQVFDTINQQLKNSSSKNDGLDKKQNVPNPGPKTYFRWLETWFDTFPSCHSYTGKAFLDSDGRVDTETFTFEEDSVKGHRDGWSLTVSPYSLAETNTKIKICQVGEDLFTIDIMGLQVRAPVLRGLETVCRLDWLGLFSELKDLTRPLLMNEEEIKLLLDLEYNL